MHESNNEANMIKSDARKVLGPRTAIKLENEGAIYELLRSTGRKMTVAEIHSSVRVSDKTVRRCLNSLLGKGFITQYGKDESNSYLFGVPDLSSTDVGIEPMVPFGHELKTVEEFIRLIVSSEHDALNLETKRPILDEETSIAIKRRMAFAILSAGTPEFNEILNKYKGGLIKLENELRYVLNLLEKFNDSPVWYDHYRDRIQMGVRELEKNDPELFRIAMTFMSNLRGSN